MSDNIRRISFFLVFVGSLLLLTIPVGFVKAQYGGTSSNIAGLASNGSNLTATVPILIPDGSVSAPSIGLSENSDSGFYGDSSTGLIYYTRNGVPNVAFGSGLYLGTQALRWGGGIGSTDLLLERDAANTLALRNSTNAQTLNIYNTYTDGSNYERAVLKWDTNIFTIGAEAAGTGTIRAVRINTSAESRALAAVFNDTYAFGGATQQYTTAYLSRSIQGSKSKSLTDAAAAASFVRIAVPTNGFAGGEVIYTATSTDGTDMLVSTNTCRFSAVDTGGTVVAGTPTCGTPATAYRRANTLVCAITGAVSTTNYDLQAACTDDKAGSQTVVINYRLDMPQPNTVTPQ